MKEKLKKVYRNKAEYYIEIIDAFDQKGIKYILLNTLVADDNPGDLDIMIGSHDYSRVELILKNYKLKYYTRYQTNQYLWNKYISDIGFIQVHIYCGIWFNNNCYYKTDIIDKSIQNDYVFNFYVFLIECYYKNKLRENQYKEYCQHIDVDVFSLQSEKINLKGSKICGLIIDDYKNGSHLKKIADSNVFYKLSHKLMRLFCNNDVEVLFLGVDGAGKTTLIEEVRKVYAKGGIFPQVIYMGLRTSFFSKQEDHKNDSESEKTIQKEVSLSPLPFTFVRFLKVCLCWLEYNLKYFVKIRLLKNTSDTVYLIDRCYIDLLMFYQNNFVKKLFTTLSFRPDKVVMITGEETILYNRKKEMSEDRYSWLYSFYKRITNLYKKRYGDRMLVVNTSSNDINTCKRCIANFIAKD